MKKKNNFRLAGISPKAWLLCLFLSIPATVTHTHTASNKLTYFLYLQLQKIEFLQFER